MLLNEMTDASGLLGFVQTVITTHIETIKQVDVQSTHEITASGRLLSRVPAGHSVGRQSAAWFAIYNIHAVSSLLSEQLRYAQAAPRNA